MRKYLLPESGRFYKANLHTHTTVSDGKLTPEECKDVFVAHGYSVVAYTDHELMIPHPELRDENFLPLTGYELTVNDANTAAPYQRTYHLNYYSPDPDRSVTKTFNVGSVWAKEHMQERITDEMRAASTASRSYKKQFVQWIIDTAAEEGALISYNHPVWSIQNYSDYTGLRGIFGVEWANTGCIRMGFPDTVQPIEDLLHEGNRMCYPLATDDCHSIADYCQSWVQIKADALEYGAIFSALKKGDFYSSTGPEINELYVEDGSVKVKTSGARQIAIVFGNRQTTAKNATADAPLTAAEFPLGRVYDKLGSCPVPNSVWFRIDVVDFEGHVARTRAYFLDELD